MDRVGHQHLAHLERTATIQARKLLDVLAAKMGLGQALAQSDGLGRAPAGHGDHEFLSCLYRQPPGQHEPLQSRG